ncbi:flagellar basal-body rod protein FlgB [Anaerosolibacter carboniphilus]|uniref:Flagellar basal body rod protein FlgB n=1 Tax=Anaerosolibacter carboniphilus TaxID=1417629 RepID=A0A841KW46_9FIRM|nr:flagellar basal body rod protein FlgB [Anaerosolibacter carboniphilus]MBB6216468.1 flagellar basal-body rod protein FlgB [Anaerosolibacter carboniphilus]
MLNKSFGNIKTLEKSLNASWLRNETISNNIANVNTPGYKRESVEFESILKDSLLNIGIEGKMTHEKHMPIGAVDIDHIEPSISKDFNSKYRRDGNNVNIDVEMASLAKNTIRYNMMTQRVTGKLNKLKSIVKDGR